jgi:hypothetical protein
MAYTTLKGLSSRLSLVQTARQKEMDELTNKVEMVWKKQLDTAVWGHAAERGGVELPEEFGHTDKAGQAGDDVDEM